MKSLYAHYIYERNGDLIIERPEGFVTYRFLNDNQVYGLDIYVLPEYRRGGVATELLIELIAAAKARGCKELISTIIPSMRVSTDSMKFQLRNGFQIDSSSTDLIVMKKEI